MEIQQLAKIKEEALREIAQTSDENTLLTIYKKYLAKEGILGRFFQSNQKFSRQPTGNNRYAS